MIAHFGSLLAIQGNPRLAWSETGEEPSELPALLKRQIPGEEPRAGRVGERRYGKTELVTE